MTADAVAEEIVSGELTEYVVSHQGRSQYSREGLGVSACGVAALNCARIVLGLGFKTRGVTEVVRKIMERGTLEDVLRPCLTWSSPAHLAVDEILKAPIFGCTLRHLETQYGPVSLSYFRTLVSRTQEHMRQRKRSACVIITRPPEIVACFCIADTKSQIFVTFDSHPRPNKHPDGAAFIFHNSVESTAVYLAELLRYDDRLLMDNAMQWQAQLLAHTSGEIFVGRSSMQSADGWKETALNASLQVLSMQARIQELEAKNRELENENIRLNVDMSDLDDQLQEAKDEMRRAKVATTRPGKEVAVPEEPVSPAASDSPIGSGTYARSTQLASGLVEPSITRSSPLSSHAGPSHTRRQNVPVDEDDVSMALRIQQEFDAEDRALQHQLRSLRRREPKFFECGICMERFQEDIVARIESCGHSYCRSCLKNYAVSKIEQHRFPIICPHCSIGKESSKPGELDDATILTLGLTDAQYQIFNEMQLAVFSIIVHCRRCLNTMFVDKAEYQQTDIIVCPARHCNYAWCKACSREVEIGGPRHSCDGSSELKHLMKKKGWKHCPGCQTPAEKVSGCNHMTCMSPGCNTHFCYLCGKRIVQSVIQDEICRELAKHYRKCMLF